MTLFELFVILHVLDFINLFMITERLHLLYCFLLLFFFHIFFKVMNKLNGMVKSCKCSSEYNDCINALLKF